MWTCCIAFSLAFSCDSGIVLLGWSLISSPWSSISSSRSLVLSSWSTLPSSSWSPSWSSLLVDYHLDCYCLLNFLENQRLTAVVLLDGAVSFISLSWLHISSWHIQIEEISVLFIFQSIQYLGSSDTVKLKLFSTSHFVVLLMHVILLAYLYSLSWRHVKQYLENMVNSLINHIITNYVCYS